MLLISSQLQLIGIWLTRCNFVFNKHVWSDVKFILRRIWKLSLERKAIYKDSEIEKMIKWLPFLETQI
jgi:hypothetical protein